MGVSRVGETSRFLGDRLSIVLGPIMYDYVTSRNYEGLD